MACRTFALTVSVDARPEQVTDFLAALDRHVGLHPYLESARRTEAGLGPEGPYQVWAVVERPPGLRIRFTATVVRCTPTSLRTYVAAPLTRLQVDMVATRGEGLVTVAEACTVTAPWPLVRYAVRNARRAHERTFALLGAALGEE